MRDARAPLPPAGEEAHPCRGRGEIDGARVAILLAVYNGAQFLPSQLQTLARQTHDRLDIWVSDDGSGDASLIILEETARNWTKGSFHILKGPSKGFAENFRSLLTNRDIDADYVAFCDQDDLWEEDKLADAVQWLARQDPHIPALYCTRTRTMTVDGQPAGYSPLFPKPPSFANAMVQSIAGANTMVMNRAAHAVVGAASCRTSFVSHDWWCYLIVSGVGGLVHYSPTPRIGYRQHPKNLIGENNSWSARMSRFVHLLKGRFTDWNQRNLDALAACHDMLTPESQRIMQDFQRARRQGLVSRLRALRGSGVYRQTRFGQLGLYLACVLRRL